MRPITTNTSIDLVNKTSLNSKLKEIIIDLLNLLVGLEFSSFDCGQLLRLNLKKKKSGSILVGRSGDFRICFRDKLDFEITKEFLDNKNIKYNSKDLLKEYHIEFIIVY